MKRLERAQRLMEKWRITYIDAIEDYRTFIKEALRDNPKSILLDACCGSDSTSMENLHPSNQMVGLDIDLEGLKKNSLPRNLVFGDLMVIPFKDNSFQVVTIHWGIEHIQEPLTALKEIYRVLKPGGRVVMMTTNTWHPLYFVAKMTPHSFHDFIRKRILDIQEEETFKTCYRANTPLQMKRLLEQAGFTHIRQRYRNNPSSYAFSTITFYLGLFFKKILDFSRLNCFKMFIVAGGIKIKARLFFIWPRVKLLGKWKFI